MKRPDTGLKFRIVRGCGQEHADAPHALTRLRPCHERPRCCRAAEKPNELTSPHIRTQLRSQHCIGSNEYFDRAQTGHQNHCRSAQPMSLMGQNEKRRICSGQLRANRRNHMGRQRRSECDFPSHTRLRFLSPAPAISIGRKVMEAMRAASRRYRALATIADPAPRGWLSDEFVDPRGTQ
jgi:hypothetical protein